MSDFNVEVLEVRRKRDRETGRLVREEWVDASGELHRDDGPALQEFDPTTGRLARRVYFLHGRMDRRDGPAVECWDPDTGAKIEERYCRDNHTNRGKTHLVAHWKRSPVSGVLTLEDRAFDGLLHCEDGPMVIERDPISGLVTVEEWFLNGSPHRDGPQAAIIHRDGATGIVYREEHWKHGQRHAAQGPAIVDRDPESGEVTSTEYWRDGEKVGGPHADIDRALEP